MCRISSVESAPRGEGVGAIPACGSKVETWKQWFGVHPAQSFEYATHQASRVPVCPKCGCHKRPHVSYTWRHFEGKHDGQAHCNYCKVWWDTERQKRK
jgi:hypothetical protein